MERSVSQIRQLRFVLQKLEPQSDTHESDAECQLFDKDKYQPPPKPRTVKRPPSTGEKGCQDEIGDNSLGSHTFGGRMLRRARHISLRALKDPRLRCCINSSQKNQAHLDSLRNEM